MLWLYVFTIIYTIYPVLQNFAFRIRMRKSKVIFRIYEFAKKKLLFRTSLVFSNCRNHCDAVVDSQGHDEVSDVRLELGQRWATSSTLSWGSCPHAQARRRHWGVVQPVDAASEQVNKIAKPSIWSGRQLDGFWMMASCCVFRPAFGCWAHPKAGRNIFFSR